MKHVAQFGWIGRLQKTTKTACGVRTAAKNIAIEADGDCPACRAKIDEDRASAHRLAEHIKAQRNGVVDATLQAVYDSLSRGEDSRYRTVYFL